VTDVGRTESPAKLAMEFVSFLSPSSKLANGTRKTGKALKPNASKKTLT